MNLCLGEAEDDESMPVLLDVTDIFCVETTNPAMAMVADGPQRLDDEFELCFERLVLSEREALSSMNILGNMVAIVSMIGTMS